MLTTAKASIARKHVKQSSSVTQSLPLARLSVDSVAHSLYRAINPAESAEWKRNVPKRQKGSQTADPEKMSLYNFCNVKKPLRGQGNHLGHIRCGQLEGLAQLVYMHL
jgi:hypothetical protein